MEWLSSSRMFLILRSSLTQRRVRPARIAVHRIKPLLQYDTQSYYCKCHAMGNLHRQALLGWRQTAVSFPVQGRFCRIPEGKIEIPLTSSGHDRRKKGSFGLRKQQGLNGSAPVKHNLYEYITEQSL